MSNRSETPDTVHGRLLESVHLSGYTFDRACSELEWLLDDDRWQRVGRGFDDINAFLASIDFSEFRIAIEQRKGLAKRLQSLQASQRATARLLGVDKETIRGDLGLKARGEKSPVAMHTGTENGDAADIAGDNSPAWFQRDDADPTSDAKRIARNAEREIERASNRRRPSPPLPRGRFALLYADPPWQYEHVATESRAIENQYPTLTLDEICALDVPAADDAVLFLWATSPKLAEAMTVIEAWRFSYRTSAVWDKQTIGMGYYFRQEHELLLVAARGSLPVPAPEDRPPSMIRARRGKHSQKPATVYALLEEMYPHFGDRDRLELFAREPRPGWARWGNE